MEEEEEKKKKKKKREERNRRKERKCGRKRSWGRKRKPQNWVWREGDQVGKGRSGRSRGGGTTYEQKKL